MGRRPRKLSVYCSYTNRPILLVAYAIKRSKNARLLRVESVDENKNTQTMHADNLYMHMHSELVSKWIKLIITPIKSIAFLCWSQKSNELRIINAT